MKSLPVDIHPGAVAEAKAATQWYREQSPLAAQAFLAELDRAVEKIAENPESWPRYFASTQRFLLKRFPSRNRSIDGRGKDIFLQRDILVS